MSNHRTGKIARAPAEVRKVVNTMLHDGSPYAAIVEFLATKGIAVTEMNVTNWKQGGYQDWEKEQERREVMQFNKEAALEIVKENEGSKIAEANLAVAASQIYDLLAEFDLKALREKLKDDPELYLATLKEVARLSKPALDFQKYRDLVAEQKRKIEAVLNEGKSKGGFSSETIEKIERELRLL